MGRTGQQMRARTKQAMVSNAKVAPRQPRSVRTFSRGQRLRYAFDNSMAQGTKALVGWLGVVSLALILVFTLLLLVTGLAPADGDGRRPGFFGELFNSFIHTLDAGTVAGDGGYSATYVVLMILLTIGGLFVVSALIGVIATGIDNKLVDLRRGRSVVIEKDHTVVLGWSDAVFTILAELAVANESRRRPVVVVMADRDKVEMEDEIREKVPELRGTRVVCRTGSPMDLGDLALTSHDAARSVIVLSPGGEEPDSEVIKVLLALTHGETDSGAHVVAEIEDPRNLDAARMIGGDRAVVLNKQETIARLIVQTSRQAGAAAVYKELFDFDGDEIYFHRDARLDGSTFGMALQAYEQVSVIGVVRDDLVTLNPPADVDVTGCDLVVIASDDSDLAGAATSSAVVDGAAVLDRPLVDPAPTRTLVLGWNQRARSVISELDAYAVAGSELVVVSAYGDPALPPLTAYTATVTRASTSDRASLETLDVAGFDQIIVLCYSDHLDVQQADARTLITLVHVRDLIGSTANGPALVSEMLDDRNRSLANVAEVDDVIVSDEIVSLMLAQLSEEGRLEVVFDELLQEAGSEIYLRPVAEYVAPGVEISYATLVESAARRGETALGYRLAALARDPGEGYGVRINPAKSSTLTPVVADRIVVLAES